MRRLIRRLIRLLFAARMEQPPLESRPSWLRRLRARLFATDVDRPLVESRPSWLRRLRPRLFAPSLDRPPVEVAQVKPAPPPLPEDDPLVASVAADPEEPRGLWIACRGYLYTLWHFVDSWLASLPWRRLVGALPFLLVVSFIAASYFLASGAPDAGFRGRVLDKQLRGAWARDDWKVARLVLNRRLRFDPDNREARFQLALAIDALGDPERATQMMYGLVFDERQSRQAEAEDGEAGEETMGEVALQRSADLRAAAWLVENRFGDRPWEELESDQRRALLALLGLLHRAEPDNLPIRQLYAQRLLAAGRYSEALPVIAGLIPQRPGAGLQAAIIARGLGETARADDYARQASDHFTKLLEAEPANAAVALMRARCQVFLEQHGEAVRTLHGALARSDEDEQRAALSQHLAEVLVAWAQATEAEAGDDPAQRLRILKMLQVALQHSPKNPRVLSMVAGQVLATAEQDDAQIVALRESLTQGTSPGVSHFIRGTAAVIKGDHDDGVFHLRLAAKTLPGSDVILNNLAHVVAERDPGDLDKALKIAQMAIRQTKQPTPYHLETRGRILFKLGRWQEAIPDLEAALVVPQLAAEAHRALAECYARLGKAEMSAQHRRAAESLNTAESAAVTGP